MLHDPQCPLVLAGILISDFGGGIGDRDASVFGLWFVEVVGGFLCCWYWRFDYSDRLEACPTRVFPPKDAAST